MFTNLIKQYLMILDEVALVPDGRTGYTLVNAVEQDGFAQMAARCTQSTRSHRSGSNPAQPGGAR